MCLREMHLLVRPVLYTACLCSLGDGEDFCCNFCYCPILCFKIKLKKNPYEYSLNAVLYIRIYVGKIIPYHYMSLTKLTACNLIGAKLLVQLVCKIHFPSSKAVISSRKAKLYMQIVYCALNKHACIHIQTECIHVT